MIAILGHLDVVPEGTGWGFPPYAAEIHHEYIKIEGLILNAKIYAYAIYELSQKDWIF